MKTRSKLFLIVSALVLLISLSQFSFAAEETYSNVVWISGFDTIKGNWSSEIESADLYDIDTISGTGEAQYQINGTEDVFNLTVTGAPDANKWNVTQNPRFPGFPDTYEITDEGWYANHQWGDTQGARSDQATSVHWSNEITMDFADGDDMSDYVITNASISAIVNGSVNPTSNVNYLGQDTTGGIEVPGDDVDTSSLYDYARFYILLTDPSGEKEYEVAAYQTLTLGSDTGPIGTLSDTLMESVDEEDLIFYLTSVLNTDYSKFNITVGIMIFCDDNWGTDYDIWYGLLVKDFNLTFTYKRNIDQFTTATWLGTGDKISSVIGNRTDVLNVQVLNATLSYAYKIDDPWPTSSPNSEFRTFVNNKTLDETIKLRFATDTYQEAKLGGYDVSSLVTSVDENITVGIQVYIADNFDFADVINISIADVELRISYLLTIQDPIPPEPTNYKPYIYSSAGLLAALATGIGLYEGIFKYPAAVRTIKGLRRKISRGRASKPIPGRDSKTVGSNIFQEQKRLLDKSSRKPQSQPSKKAAPKKDTSQYKDVSPPKEKKMPEKKILENKKGSSE